MFKILFNQIHYLFKVMQLGFFEPFLIERETFDEVVLEDTCCSNSKFCSFGGIDAISYRDNNIQVVKRSFVGLTITGSVFQNGMN
jgi:hypothetical protein